MEHHRSESELPTSTTTAVEDSFHSILSSDLSFHPSLLEPTPFIRLPNPKPQLQAKPLPLQPDPIQAVQPRKRKRSDGDEIETTAMYSQSRPRLHTEHSYSSQYSPPQELSREDAFADYDQYASSSSMTQSMMYPSLYSQPPVGMLQSQGLRNTSVPPERSRHAWSEGPWTTSPQVSESAVVPLGIGSSTAPYGGYGTVPSSGSWYPTHTPSSSYQMYVKHSG